MTACSVRPVTGLTLTIGLAVELVLATLTLASPAQAQKIRSDFFGMHDSLISSGSVPGVTTGATRLWDTETSWRHIETSDGTFDWRPVDRAVATARAAGLRPLLVLGQTPRFHARKPGAPGAYGDGATSMPDLPAWKRYVGKAAKRYGNTIDYQVWNEPNVIQYWSGSVAQMARLTAAAGQRIESVVGRTGTVVAPAMPLRLGMQQKWYQRYWSAEVGRKSVASFVDVVAANLYPLENQAPEAQLKLLQFAKRALPKAARGKPIWNTEINYGLRGGLPAKDISATKEAAFTSRTLMLNAGSGVRRVYFYSWGIGDIANTHLVKSDRTTLTRAGRAWQVTRGWIQGTDVKRCQKTSRGRLKGLHTCTARESTRVVRRVYWKPSGRSVPIRTHPTTTKWSDLSGDTTRRKGPFPLEVGGSPVMVTSRR